MEYHYRSILNDLQVDHVREKWLIGEPRSQQIVSIGGKVCQQDEEIHKKMVGNLSHSSGKFDIFARTVC